MKALSVLCTLAVLLSLAPLSAQAEYFSLPAPMTPNGTLMPVNTNPGGQPASAQTTADPGTIAYVKRSTGDIHLISPDGTGDRVLWTNPDPDHRPLALAWRPDGRELAFSSQHEWQCSIYDGDVYAIGYSGGGYRRITNAPACAELANLPKGTVTVFVQDVFGSSFVYVAGAPGIKKAQL